MFKKTAEIVFLPLWEYGANDEKRCRHMGRRRRRSRGNIKTFSAALLIAAALLFASSCSHGGKELKRTEFLLDTVVTITLYGWDDEGTLDRAMDEISRLDALFDVDGAESEINRISSFAGKERVKVSDETLELLSLSKKYAELSGGLLDVTAGPLISLWDISRGGHFPETGERLSAMELISDEQLCISDDGYVFLEKEGMRLDVGATAKGYIADKVKELLVAEGVEHAVIDLGRNVLLVGAKPDGENFTVGIQSPDKDTGELAEILSARDMSIVTSGTYERFFVYGGKRYHHILDPYTGFPAETGLAAVTVVSRSSTDGDALSTACLLMGEEKGAALIESLPDTEALFFREDGTKAYTSGFGGYIRK